MANGWRGGIAFEARLLVQSGADFLLVLPQFFLPWDRSLQVIFPGGGGDEAWKGPSDALRRTCGGMAFRAAVELVPGLDVRFYTLSNRYKLRSCRGLTTMGIRSLAVQLPDFG